MFPKGGSRLGSVFYRHFQLFYDGDYQPGSVFKYVDYGQQVTLSDPGITVSGKSFGGWENNTDGSTRPAGTTVPINKDTHYNVVWN